MTAKTNQQGAPEALRHASYLEDFFISEVVNATRAHQIAAELRRLYAENERLAALVDAQQPAPSAAATEGEVPLPLLVRDIAADLGTTPIQVCTALAQLGFGGHSVNMAVTPRMAKSLRAHFASTTSQADSQLAKFTEILQSWCGARCLPMPSSDDCQSLMLSLEAARAPADSQPAPIDMVLHCPACGLQHIDASEPPAEFEPGAAQWNNPPHRSHLCHGCGHIWRPADVPTNGVKEVKTKGKADSPIAASAQAGSVTAPAGGVLAGPIYRIRTKNTKHVVWTTVPKHEYLAALEAPEIFECGLISTPPTQAADSVLEDAARLDWLDQQCEAYGFQDIHEGNRWEISGAYANVREAIDAERSARKQGANHD